MEINVEKPKAVRMSRQPCLRVLRAFSSVVRQMSGENPQRRGTALTLPNDLCCSMYCLFLSFYVLCVCVCVCV